VFSSAICQPKSRPPDDRVGRVFLQILRRFVYLLQCPKERFVYRTREGDPRLQCALKMSIVITLLLPNFQVHQHVKVIFVATCITSARRIAPLRTRYTNRLNPENNRDIRNVTMCTGCANRYVQQVASREVAAWTSIR